MALGGDAEPPWAASPASLLCVLLRATQPVPSQPGLTRPAPAAFLERASPAGTTDCLLGKHGHSPSLTVPLGCGVRGALCRWDQGQGLSFHCHCSKASRGPRRLQH